MHIDRLALACNFTTKLIFTSVFSCASNIENDAASDDVVSDDFERIWKEAFVS